MGSLSRIKKSGEKLFYRCINGEVVFFPWGYPGEGFVIKGDDLLRIKTISNIYYTAICLYNLAIIVWDAVFEIDNEIYDYLLLSFYVSVLPLYVQTMRLAKNGKSIYCIPKTSRPAKAIFAITILPLFFFQIYSWLTFRGDIPAIMQAVFLVGALFSVFIYVRVIITRGHYFSS